jgi:hypothetical protein
MIPFQAMVTSVPEVTKRGSFNAISASIQQISGGVASVIAGHIVEMGADGRLQHFEVVGYVVVATTLLGLYSTYRIKVGLEQRAAAAGTAPAV